MTDISREREAFARLERAATVVFDGLNARIDAACGNSVPVFTGIAGLNDALHEAREILATLTPTAPSGEVVERVADAIEAAECRGREGPFGSYDYGHDTDFYGPAPEGGRYVIRDFRDPASPNWGKWLHQTNDRDEHEAVFRKMTREHIAIVALEAVSTDAEVEMQRLVAKWDDTDVFTTDDLYLFVEALVGAVRAALARQP